ncbi:MAG: outer membrane beta-barrel protein [Algibacter sp.]
MQVFKYVSITCFLLLSQTIFSQENENVKEEDEEEQTIIVGLAPTLELNETLYGVNGRVYYGLNDTFCFGPEISYFPYQNIDDDYEKSIIDLNINAHYIFELSEKWGLYPLSGINYTIEKERLINQNNDSEKIDEFGINYGVGIHYKISDLYVFSEFKGIIGQLNAEFISAGIIFNFSL